ncbi:hypothetical protein WG66_006095 [Moniliophthora roreri]|uniref:BTB domain-containing protein n=1 Tax=Moniliophthora roreri TaxID=221103 RepID=A0A0W0G6D4_MONRR|nr:hypothetical protein WG66_006095 [Moniliophthora roreri]
MAVFDNHHLLHKTGDEDDENQGRAPICQVSDCKLGVDITLQSSDGRLFGSHMKNLETFNAGFPSADSVTNQEGDIVHLSEDGKTLELLLRFSHNIEHTEISELGLATVLSLAKAADKYGNAFAAGACREAINILVKSSPDNALLAIHYKMMHSDFRNVDEVVQSTMRIPLRQVVDTLKVSSRVLGTYVLYKEQWTIAHRNFEKELDDSKRFPCNESKDREVVALFKSMLRSSPSLLGFEAAEKLCQQVFGIGVSSKWSVSVPPVKEALSKFPKWAEVYATV